MAERFTAEQIRASARAFTGWSLGVGDQQPEHALGALLEQAAAAEAGAVKMSRRVEKLPEPYNGMLEVWMQECGLWREGEG